MLTFHNGQSHHAECRCAGCRVFIVMLNVVAPKKLSQSYIYMGEVRSQNACDCDSKHSIGCCVRQGPKEEMRLSSQPAFLRQRNRLRKLPLSNTEAFCNIFQWCKKANGQASSGLYYTSFTIVNY